MTTARLAICCTALAASSLALGLVGLPPASLWMDEVWSATSAAATPWDAVALTLRHDLHPPLYYLQISLWGLGGQHDRWLFLNSLLWAAAAVWLLTWFAARRHDPAVGLAAGLLLATAPLSGLYQHELRMYTMLMALAVLAWAAAEWLATTPPGARLRPWWRLVVVQWLMAYTHGVAPLMAGTVGLYALMRAHQTGGRRRTLRALQAQAVFAVGCVPVLINSWLRTVGYPAPSWREVAGTLATFTAGDAHGAALVIGVMVYAVLIGLGAARADTRPLALTVAAPLLLIGAVTVVVKPVWQTRLVVYALPLACLLAALLLGRLRAGRPRLATAVLAAVAVAAAAQTVAINRDAPLVHDYRSAAVALQDRLEPGDTVYAARVWDHWGVLRYTHGPRWGDPLTLLGAADQPRWAARAERVGPVLAGLLRLGPTSDRIVKGGVTWVIGPATVDALADCDRIWVLQSLWHGEERDLLPGHRLVESVDVPTMRLVGYTRVIPRRM